MSTIGSLRFHPVVESDDRDVGDDRAGTRQWVVDEDDPKPRKRFPLDLEAILGEDPHQTLRDVVSELHSRPDPDIEFIEMLRIGPLESLLHQGHGEELWPEIERLARTDPLFRRALRSVWAYDSAEYDRRKALLTELGECWEITVRFTVEPEGFSPDPPLSWRAFEAEGHITNRRLAETLRAVADWLDGQDPAGDAAGR